MYSTGLVQVISYIQYVQTRYIGYGQPGPLLGKQGSKRSSQKATTYLQILAGVLHIVAGIFNLLVFEGKFSGCLMLCFLGLRGSLPQGRNPQHTITSSPTLMTNYDVMMLFICWLQTYAYIGKALYLTGNRSSLTCE